MIEHVEVVGVVVDAPDGLCLNRAGGDTEDYGANTALIMIVTGGNFSMDEGGDAKGEE